MNQKEFEQLEKTIAKKSEESAIRQVNKALLMWMATMLIIGGGFITIMTRSIVSEFRKQDVMQQEQILELKNITTELKEAVIKYSTWVDLISRSKLSKFNIDNSTR